MAAADRMFYAGFDLPVQWWILYRIAVISVLAPSTPVLMFCSKQYTLEAFHMRCQRQILDVYWWVHVSNAEMLQRSGLSTIGDILRHRRLSLFAHVARLDPGVQHMMLCVWWWIPMYPPKASWRRPPGRPRNVWLKKIEEDANAVLLSTLWRSEIAVGHGAAQRPLGLHDDDDGDDDEGCKTCVKSARLLWLKAA